MIKLRSINLESFNYQNIEHYNLKRNLALDPAVCCYVSSNFDNFVKEPSNNDIYEVGKTYVIKDNKKRVGTIGSTHINDNGVIDIWCAISGKYRRCGYAEKAVVQLTEYLLDNFKELSNIELVINKNNKGSNIVAEYSGYTLVKKQGDKNIYHYL